MYVRITFTVSQSSTENKEEEKLCVEKNKTSSAHAHSRLQLYAIDERDVSERKGDLVHSDDNFA